MFFAVAAVFILFSAGKLLTGSKEKQKTPEFENLLVVHPKDYVNLISPEDKEVKELAQTLKTPVNAYYFVRDFVAFDPSMPAAPPHSTIKTRHASCTGKAALLCSLYGSLGIPDEHMRIILGEINYENAVVEHAWVEVKLSGAWLQQDPTDLLGRFEFADFPGRSYSKRFSRREGFCFNGTGFAVVSQMNRMR